MGCGLFKNTLEKCTLENTEEFTLAGKTLNVKVIDVYDGDTITIAFPFSKRFYKKRCRIYGVNCPEIKSRDLAEKNRGLQSKQFVTKLVLNKLVKIDFTLKEDKYGRLLGIVYLNGEERLDKKIINEGFGKEYFGGKK